MYIIETNAFKECSSLQNVLFSEDSSLKIIDYDAFMYCTSLNNIILPHHIDFINKNVFYGCDSLTKYSFPKRFENDLELMGIGKGKSQNNSKCNIY